MYIRRIQLIDYGPIGKLDIACPFDGAPKPLVFVGPNGSGKTVVLSQLANGLFVAQQRAYPYSPEVDVGKAFKLRSPLYIKAGAPYAFCRVDFEDDMHFEELLLRRPKGDYPHQIVDASSPAAGAWRRTDNGSASHLDCETISHACALAAFSRNCALFFPEDRFEYAAWLNEESLTTVAERRTHESSAGRTDRLVLSGSSLKKNVDWLFDVAYDLAVAEPTHVIFPRPIDGQRIARYDSPSRSILRHAKEIVRAVVNLKTDDVEITFGGRRQRVVSLTNHEGTRVVPSLFQLSGGEVSLANIFLGMLRDFDHCSTPFQGAQDVRGIVIVDEVDMRLHVSHQHEVLPRLMKMFPNVQFIVTTHSPLVCLGLEREFGKGGVDIIQLPSGDKVSPEDFAEFARAYRVFQDTNAHAAEVRRAVERSNRPMVFLEGKTDVRYVKKAAELLDETPLLDRFDVLDAEGNGQLRNIWKALTKLPHIVVRPVVLIYDCDANDKDEECGQLYRRKMRRIDDHPITDGVENRFPRCTLERARNAKTDLINIETEHTKVERGISRTVPETWTVDRNEKKNLCEWLCREGRAEDFSRFGEVFDMLREILDDLKLQQDPPRS